MAPTGTDKQIAWWREPTRDQWLAWTAGWFGWTLDAFDFTIFLLLLVPITQEFHVPLTAAAVIVTLTLWMRLLGACSAGWMADRLGRRIPLMISIAWYSVCSGEAGREIEGPMAIVILGGFLTSTLLNLLVLPTLALRYGWFRAAR